MTSTASPAAAPRTDHDPLGELAEAESLGVLYAALDKIAAPGKLKWASLCRS